MNREKASIYNKTIPRVCYILMMIQVGIFSDPPATYLKVKFTL
jgi:hypothetical protein